jgi:hypothetical protein
MSSLVTDRAILEEALALTNSYGLARGAFVKYRVGYPDDLDELYKPEPSEDVCEMCTIGFITRAMTNLQANNRYSLTEPAALARRLLDPLIDEPRIEVWNDKPERTLADVQRLLQTAIGP